MYSPKINLDIVGIKTKDGYLLSLVEEANDTYQNSTLKDYNINNKRPKDTFLENWVFTKDKPEIITQIIKGNQINFRYELIDKSLANEKIPLILNKKDVVINEYGDWEKQYSHLQSLYKLKYDYEPDKEKTIAFEYKELLEVDELNNIDLGWEIQKSKYDDNKTKVTSHDLVFQLIDKIMFPKIVVENKCPVMLQSEIFYKIIREYIKTNINYEVACISSDYDFCFGVEKRIKKLEPENIKLEIKKSNGKSFKNPKFVDKTIEYAGKYSIFKMTSKKDHREGYPILPDIYANNINELKIKVDNILKELIELINSEVKLCPCCRGTGVENGYIKNIDINELINNSNAL